MQRSGDGGRSAYGGNTQYGGATVYDAAKTPMAVNTPSCYPQSQWGGGVDCKFSFIDISNVFFVDDHNDGAE